MGDIDRTTKTRTIRVFMWLADPLDADAVDVTWTEWVACRALFENEEWQRDEAICAEVPRWFNRLIADEIEPYPTGSDYVAAACVRLDGSDHVREYAIYWEHHDGHEFSATEFRGDNQIELVPTPPRFQVVRPAPVPQRSDDELRTKLAEQNKLLHAALTSVVDSLLLHASTLGLRDSKAWKKVFADEEVQAARALVDRTFSSSDPAAVARGMQTLRCAAGLGVEAGTETAGEEIWF